jgi:hypothetical protein
MVPTGVTDYTVNLEEQKVLVTGTIGYDDLLEKIKKTGKEVCINLFPPVQGLKMCFFH